MTSRVIVENSHMNTGSLRGRVMRTERHPETHEPVPLMTETPVRELTVIESQKMTFDVPPGCVLVIDRV